MSKYMYKAVNYTDSVLEGVLEADNEKTAAEIIRARGYYPQSIKEIAENREKADIELGYKIKTSDLAIFCNQFAVVLKAGVSILQSLDILSAQTENKKLEKVLKDVYSKIQRGSSVSEAFASHSKRFPKIFISMLETGEASGNMDLVLERMGVAFTKEHKLNQKVRAAMIYPAILSVVAFMVVIFLFLAVVPTFASMYESSGMELPAITRIVMGFGGFVSENIILLGVIASGIIIAVIVITRMEMVKYEIDRLKLKIPVIGNLILTIITARFTQNMATLLSSGISLTQAINITTGSLGNNYVSKKVSLLINEVRSGKGFAGPLEALGIFKPMVVHMVRLGEESGSLDELLTQTSLFYESEAEAATTKLTALIEPIIIVFLGLVVLLIVLSVLLPMFGMYEMI